MADDNERNDTKWQQGFVLNAEGAEALKLTGADNPDGEVVLLVSHDCDLVEAKAVEPFCEIIVGRKIERIDGTFAGAKNPRRLHLPFSAGETKISAEFVATNKRQIEKQSLLSCAPDGKILLSSDEHSTLQLWLALRYQRAIFPDEFDRRLKAKPAEIHKRLEKIIKLTGDDLVGILFDLDGGKNVIHNDPDDPYALGIYLLYKVSVDPGRAEEAAKKAAQSIRDIFRQFFFGAGRWQNIELRGCWPMSEDAITFYQWRSLKLWQS